MNSDILVALLALVGTIFGSLVGAYSTNKLLSYRIDLLEGKVNKLNEIFERMTVAAVSYTHLTLPTILRL